MYDGLQSEKIRDPVMELQARRSPEVWNFVGTSFGADAGLDLCSEKVHISEGVFQLGSGTGWYVCGGGVVTKGRDKVAEVGDGVGILLG